MKNKLKNFMLLAITAILFASCSDDQPQISVNWTFSPEENITAGDIIYFTNTSNADVDVEYKWDFGDGNTSTEESPSHVYAEPGSYMVYLSLAYESSEKGSGQEINVDVDYSYIINAGSWSGGKSTITAYNKYKDEVTNGYYKAINGVALISNFQYAYNYNGNIYFMGNEADEVSWVDNKTFLQTESAITQDIVKPRYCVGKDNYLYVSCWGGDVWSDPTVSYIAKVNLNTNMVEQKIALHGGPEGLEMVNNKLYAALNYKDSVAVIDITNDAISYIETPATSSYFLKDNNENLYVSIVSYDPTATKGLGYINTNLDVLEEIYVLPTISSAYVNIMAPNADFTKIYVVEDGASWGDPGALGVFDVASKSFESSKFQTDVAGLNGVAVNNDEIICFISEGVTGNGSAKSYSTNGTFIKEYETGIAPFMLLNVE